MKVVQIFKNVYILLEDVYHSIKHNHTSERMFRELFWKQDGIVVNASQIGKFLQNTAIYYPAHVLPCLNLKPVYMFRQSPHTHTTYKLVNAIDFSQNIKAGAPPGGYRKQALKKF